MPDAGAAAFRPPLAGADYFLTRAVFLRALGFLYVVAFAILVRQVVPLIGAHGLLPVEPFLERVSEHYDGMPAAAFRNPTLFWLGASDAALLAGAWIGLLLG